MHARTFIKLALVLTLSVTSTAFSQATPLSSAIGSPEIATALSALQKGQAQQAAQQIEALVAQPAHAGDPRLWFALAQARVQSEENQAALQAIDKAIELGGRHSDYLVVGLCCSDGRSAMVAGYCLRYTGFAGSAGGSVCIFHVAHCLHPTTEAHRSRQGIRYLEPASHGYPVRCSIMGNPGDGRSTRRERVRKTIHEADRQIADETLPSPMPRDSMGLLLQQPIVTPVVVAK
ncbi:MAG: hypothetical protein HC898_05075 [Phycisphaerales bacterium]|nr:hypothetical protein [Phycisphaerales bacterium]